MSVAREIFGHFPRVLVCAALRGVDGPVTVDEPFTMKLDARRPQI